nr:unnamed protein product [Callosobruchus chinensis]
MELQPNDPNDFLNYLRMDEDTFKHLFNLVSPHFIVCFQQILSEQIRPYPLTRL